MTGLLSSYCSNPTVAVDAMGGDFGVPVVVPAALQALEQDADLTIRLVGDPTQITEALTAAHALHHPRLVIHPTTQIVAMDESPVQALRTKKDSSMRVAINLVHTQEASACVSAGNTGALMATARFVLKTLPGVDRPAIMALFPTVQPGIPVRILDLGANVDCTPDQLLQFAVMGSVLLESMGIPRPRVGLLNIGSEAIKGNEQIKHTAPLLQAQRDLNYVGFVEGDGVYSGDIDIVVCDGFVGNVLLKNAEGLAKMIAGYTKAAFLRNWYTKIAGLIGKPVLQGLRKQINPSLYNGGCLLGLQGIVVKSHGGADILGFATAIREAARQACAGIPEHIGHQVRARLSSADVI